MSIELPEEVTKFPKYLPNDLENMIHIYPMKFPKVKEEYERVVRIIGIDPEEYQKYGNYHKEILIKALEKLKMEYKQEEKSLDFLVKMDQRLNKLFCFRFWIVNYLFADGPIHEFYVGHLKKLVRKLVPIEKDVEAYENKIASIERLLMQTDYADDYLKYALNCNIIIQFLKNICPEQTEAVRKLLDKPNENQVQINQIWEMVIKKIEEENNEEMMKALKKAYIQVKFRKSMLPLYNLLTHAVEFEEENKELQIKYDQAKKEIDQILLLAKEKLQEEYELLETAYLQIKNFSMYKDVIGDIDGVILPFWFGIHDEIREILYKTNPSFVSSPSGQAGMFYLFVWYLPEHLKGVVMTPDFTDFSLEDL